MEQSVRLQRSRTNVDFLDEKGEAFAGLHLLQDSTITVVEALDMMRACFHFTFPEISEGNNDQEYGWGIYPFRGQISGEAFSLEKPLVKGRYYVVRHAGPWEGIGLWKDHILGESPRYMIVQVGTEEGRMKQRD